MSNQMNVVVTEFHEVGGDNNWTKATITIELDNADGFVTQAADGSLTVSGATTMNFAFWQPTSIGGLTRDPGYTPVGIYFLEDASDPSRSDPEGITDFPSCTVSTQMVGTTSYRNMQVCAADTTKGLNWEFYIVLQRVSDGKLGIIDPKVRNQP